MQALSRGRLVVPGSCSTPLPRPLPRTHLQLAPCEQDIGSAVGQHSCPAANDLAAPELRDRSQPWNTRDLQSSEVPCGQLHQQLQQGLRI